MRTRDPLFAIALSIAAPVALGATPAGRSVQEPSLTVEQAMEHYRSDLQSKRADVIAKALTLSAEQAGRFWPLFDQFQKEQNEIIDEQAAAILRYGEHHAELTAAEALAYVDALLKSDRRMHELRTKWLAKFQTVLPPNLAARAIQVDRRLSLVAQLQVAQRVPLVR